MTFLIWLAIYIVAVAVCLTFFAGADVDEDEQ